MAQQANLLAVMRELDLRIVRARDVALWSAARRPLVLARLRAARRAVLARWVRELVAARAWERDVPDTEEWDDSEWQCADVLVEAVQ